MNSKHTPDRVILTVAADQASHGETLVLQSQDGTVYFRTPGNCAIDKITASEAAKRWNTHADLLAALRTAHAFMWNMKRGGFEVDDDLAKIDDILARVDLEG